MIARLRKKDSFTSRLRKANEKVKSKIKREQFHKRQERNLCLIYLQLKLTNNRNEVIGFYNYNEYSLLFQNIS